MNIEKIPGFEKTPEKIVYIADAMKVYSIAGMEIDINDDHLFENAKKLKSILDNRNEFLKLLLIHQRAMNDSSPFTETEMSSFDCYYKRKLGKSFKDLIAYD